MKLRLYLKVLYRRLLNKTVAKPVDKYSNYTFSYTNNIYVKIAQMRTKPEKNIEFNRSTGQQVHK